MTTWKAWFERYLSPLELGAYVILAAIGVLLSAKFLSDHSDAERAARLAFNLRNQAEIRRTANHVETRILQVYQGLRTIARLPAVRQLSTTAASLSSDAQTSIQEIYDNLANNVSVSELYIVPATFDPDATDPSTGQPQRPLLTFDALIVGRHADLPRHTAPAKHETDPQVDEVEIFEYRAMQRQISWLGTHYPVEATVKGLAYPAIVSEEVLTCDNTGFSPSQPNDDRRKGIVYSVPFYGSDGALRGTVVAVIRTDVLAALLPSGRFAIADKSRNFIAAKAEAPIWHRRDLAADLEHGTDRNVFATASNTTLNLPSSNIQWTLLSTRDDGPALLQVATGLTERLRLEMAALLSFLALLALTVRWQSSRLRVIGSTNRDLEHRIAERTSALQSATRDAETANSAKSRFLANVSHEIRSPIHAILSAAELLERSRNAGPIAQNVDIIQSASRSLLNLVNDVLDLSAIEQGRAELKPEAFSPEALAREVADMVRHIADRKRLALEHTVTGSIQPLIIADRMRLQQVVLNLAGNAVRYTHVGGVTIDLSTPPAAGDDEPILRVEVSDSGPGIEPALRSELFEPFRRGSHDGEPSVGGAGLGLAISKQLVELMGGTLTFTCPPSGGTRFVVRVPYRQPAPAAAAAERLPIAPAVRATDVEFSARILLAEDNPQLQTLTRTLLEQLGCSVEVVGNGLDAVERFTPGSYDIVLMDRRMPGLDGIEATKRIRALEAAGGVAPVAIVALTAQALVDDRDACLSAGMNDFLGKPYSRSDLIAVLSRHLDKT